MYSSYQNLSNKSKENFEKTLKVKRLETMEDKAEAIESHKICVIDIYGDWCGPCKLIESEYANLANKYNNEDIIFCKENIDDGLTSRESISGVPTFIFFKDSKFVTNVVGADLDEVENVFKLLKD